MCFSIPYYFIFGIGIRAYKQLSEMSINGQFLGKATKNKVCCTAFFASNYWKNPRRMEKPSVLFSYALRYMDPKTGELGILDRLWILGLLLGFVVAFLWPRKNDLKANAHAGWYSPQSTKRESSVYTRKPCTQLSLSAVVMIWAILELAKRPELLESLREEIITETDVNGAQHLTYASIRNAERLDSFIREVMRTKGDTLSAVRHTTRDVQIAGYDIPSGQFIALWN